MAIWTKIIGTAHDLQPGDVYFFIADGQQVKQGAPALGETPSGFGIYIDATTLLISGGIYLNDLEGDEIVKTLSAHGGVGEDDIVSSIVILRRV